MLTICFTTPKRWTLVSWIIKFFTKSKVSHVAIGMTIQGVPVLLEATAGGVKVSVRKKFEKSDRIVEEYAAPKYLNFGLPHAVSHIGDKYDYAALLGFAWLLTLWHIFKIRVKNPLASSRAVVCSEFILHLDHAHKVEAWKLFDPERTHAEDLRKACEASPEFKRL